MDPARASRFPNAFIVGAAKCGTSSLHDYLRQHPDVFMTLIKEPHFFNRDSEYERGIDYYLDTHFKGAEAFPVRGESSPSYLNAHEWVLPRLMEHVDAEAKFLVLLRDPVARAWSHYQHLARREFEDQPFERALELEEERMRQDRHAWRGYFGDGLYTRPLASWFAAFPRERFLVLLTHDLQARPAEVLAEVCRFLGIPDGFEFQSGLRRNPSGRNRSRLLMLLLYRPNLLKSLTKAMLPRSVAIPLKARLNELNLAGGAPKLDPALAARLRRDYREEIEALEDLLGRDLSVWKTGG